MKTLFFLFILSLSSVTQATDPCTRHPLCDELNEKSFACSEGWEGNGNRWDTLVDMKTCNKIWEAAWSSAETVSGYRHNGNFYKKN